MPLLPGFRRRVGMLLDEHVRRVSHVRNALATKYLSGDGIEIGALHKPLPMPRKARVRYVDRMTAADLRRHYPELATWDLVDPDIIDDGERLETVADNSLDFVVANHFIEHTEDPLGAIGNHLRVLKPGGVIFMAVPDKRRTFDRDRQVTTIDHLVRDHRDGPEISRAQHYGEWARDVDHADDVPAHAQALMEQAYSIHFHVWTRDAFYDLLEHARTHEHLPFSIEQAVENGFEFIVVLRKTQPG
jgi:SAM-dependent methyltransferase